MEPGIVFGLGAAAAFGAGDFLGGFGARRVGGVVVAAGAQVVGLALLLAALAIFRPGAPDPAALAFGAVAGLFGAIGLAALYRGLSLGSMGIVTALSGAGSVLIPLLIGVALRGNAIAPLQWLGIGFAVAAVVAASGATLSGVRAAGLVLAGIAAVGFGLWFSLLDVAAESGDLWALVASRGSASGLMVAWLALRGGARTLLSIWPVVLATGAADVGGNAAFVLALATIPVGIAAALSGIYPMVTMLLARLVLREALPRLGLVAVVLAVIGIVLISAG
jgi:drug/metabolite transporter (DMT)-like permease